MSDLSTGAQRSTRALLHELLDTLEPLSRRLGAGGAMARARSLVARNGAIVQREVARDGGPHSIGRWLSERFLDPYLG